MIYIYFWLAMIALTVIGGIVLGSIAAFARKMAWGNREKKDRNLSNQLNNGRHRINGGFRNRPRRG
jgi:hypothetical protein